VPLRAWLYSGFLGSSATARGGKRWASGSFRRARATSLIADLTPVAPTRSSAFSSDAGGVRLAPINYPNLSANFPAAQCRQRMRNLNT
jgi:hypothetical protein